MDNQNEITLKDIVTKINTLSKYVLSKWLKILAISLLGGICGLIYAQFKKPVYVAETSFVLEDGEKGGGLGAYAGIAAIAGVDLGGGGGGLFDGENIVALYKSRAMIKKALLTKVKVDNDSLLLIDKFLEFNDIRNDWKETEFKNISFADPENFSIIQDSILQEVIVDINENYLTVGKPDKKLSILKVEVRASDKDFAKLFNEQIVSTVNNFYLETKTRKSLENVNILQRQTDSVRSVLNGAIYTAASTSDATPNLNPTRQVLQIPIQRSQVNAETNKEMLSEMVKNLELSKMALRKETPLIQVIDRPIFPLQKIYVSRTKGFAIGMVMFSILSVFIILLSKIFKDSMNGKSY